MLRLISFADVITLTNAVFGFLAILLVLSGQPWYSAVFIFLGLLADGLDGYVARRLGNSTIGEYLESLADMLSLSVAPLLLVYATFKGMLPAEGWLLPLFGLVLMFSLVCSFIRLSSFSFLKDSQFFLGLPTSVSALFLVALSILKPDLAIVVPVILLLAFLMISPVRFPKPGIKLNTVTAALIILVILFHEASSIIIVYILLLALVLYVIVGPIYLTIQKRP
ncbi:MAG TPA: CDP-alcohol phosphatidyltransferase family protein [Candidatus Thermoplasmatota archaeon]|nr:CDP-alcohol phosphatidyltransferase family protein [Candidatus Thermoplasmatota archaeon]